MILEKEKNNNFVSDITLSQDMGYIYIITILTLGHLNFKIDIVWSFMTQLSF